MQGTRVLLARHAETAAPDRFHGAESDIGLSALGARQAELLGESLKTIAPDAVYSFRDAERSTRQSHDRPRLQSEAGLDRRGSHERRIGPLSGLSRDEGWSIYAASRSRWIEGDLDHTHEGGESYTDVRRRVVPILQELTARHSEQTVIIIAHGVVIRVILTSLLAGSHPSEFDRFAIDFASVNDLRFDGKVWTATALNQVVASEARPIA